MGRRNWLVLCAWFLVGTARGEELERVPLKENFFTGEIVTATGVALVGAASIVFQNLIAEGLDKDNLIGAPRPGDVQISDVLYAGPGAGQFLGGVPDVVGQVVAPGVSILYYGGGAALYGLTGKSWTGDGHADHRFFAFLEAYGITVTSTQLVKFSVGRTRPDTVFERGPKYEEYLSSGVADAEANLSFFSGHSSSSFCIAAFVTRDLTDWLVREPLADASPAARLILGRALPAVALYGAAGVVGLSRIVDQRHFASDVLIGALVGAASGNLFYALHFDASGRPRRRAGQDLTARVVPFPGGLAIEGQFK